MSIYYRYEKTGGEYAQLVIFKSDSKRIERIVDVSYMGGKVHMLSSSVWILLKERLIQVKVNGRSYILEDFKEGGLFKVKPSV